ncbi:MAG: hypothetical protein PHE27_01075 [Alphaproteobacteria bacterium]|nr:hypothetical protein [Alphaproteobacteria bacterium]
MFDMKYGRLVSILGVLALCGCTEQVMVASSAASIYLSRPEQPGPADTRSQIPPHEVWCYRTMADVDCYANPQDVHASRLVNVQPQNYYPLTPQAYEAEVAGMRPVFPVEEPAKEEKQSGWFDFDFDWL